MGRNDQTVASITQGSELTLQIPKEAKVEYSGFQQAFVGTFAPVAGSFEVSGGKLISKVGDIQKEAMFKDWAYVYAAGDKKKVLGWGPCLTSGEVIVSNIFVRSVPSEYMVENRFDTEDFGPGFTLIRLDPSNGDRLCIWVKRPDTGMKVVGVSDFGSGTFSGKVNDSIDYTDLVLVNTAGYIGTTTTFGDKKFVRQKEGWFLGTKKMSK